MGMNIGELAALEGVPAATVRYYERRGLIPKAARTPSGYRQYHRETAERLRFIKHAQEMGFGSQELLELRVDDPGSCALVEATTREKIAEVRRRIGELERLEAVLERLARSCRARTPTDECPVLEALAERAHAPRRASATGSSGSSTRPPRSWSRSPRRCPRTR